MEPREEGQLPEDLGLVVCELLIPRLDTSAMIRQDSEVDVEIFVSILRGAQVRVES